MNDVSFHFYSLLLLSFRTYHEDASPVDSQVENERKVGSCILYHYFVASAFVVVIVHVVFFFSFGQNHQYLGYICFRVVMMFSSQEDDPVRLAGKCGFSFFIYLLLMVYKFTYIKLMFFPQLSSFFLTLHGIIEPARKFTFCNRSKFYFVLSFVCF